MTIVGLLEWFAMDSKHEAELTDEPKQREIWIRLAELWAAAARWSREEAEHRAISPGYRNSSSGTKS
jgi:hypothetical protein